MAHANRPRRQHLHEQGLDTTIVIIPDAFCRPEHYDLPVTSRRALGADIVIVVQNPSTRLMGASAAGVPAGLYDDTANARVVVEGLVRDGRSVLVVAHSYGALVASECVKGLGREGLMGVQPGGVVRMVLIAGIVPLEGQSLNEAVNGRLGIGPPDDVVGGFMYHKQEKLAARFYSSLPACRSLEHAGATNTEQSVRSFEERLRYAGYRGIPVTYMVTTADQMVPVEL
ncbi:hypothetical protein CSAL01_07198 [Colletotrichum salicis]|uniref:AB hydrolase-1 domain-containing protein n=1 Tax=Colletotrichum salicis TaxID=1209931 RepID=A0A135T8J3_9PEZI|nr:hypothetical protein CSAL01_07198 [Colletotrichum salicis]